MKKTFKKLRAVERRLRECGNELAAMPQLPYYRLFSRPGQLEVETEALITTLAQLENEKQQLLEALKNAIEQKLSSSVPKQLSAKKPNLSILNVNKK